MEREPRALLATTTWWPSLGVLASALEQAGFDVTMLCPKGHVAMRATRFAARELDKSSPSASLLATLDAVAPDLIVPGDERVVDHLRHLYEAGPPRWREAIERAIGCPSAHAFLTARSALLEVAATTGFAVPETRAVMTADELETLLARVPPPWVVKADGAWGGEGVRITGEAEACRRAFLALRRGTRFGLALRRKLVNGDPSHWNEWRRGRRPAVSLQVHVNGRPANCAIFALHGEVLGATTVRASKTCGDHGPSTLVEVLDRPDILASAKALVGQLGLSGFLGFDFIMDQHGAAHLIEMNPRITLPCRIRGSFGLDPVSAAARAFGAVPRDPPSRAFRTRFAAFPLAWLVDPSAVELADCRADVPWREPEMVRDSLRPLWPERGVLAGMPSCLRRWRPLLGGKRPPPDYRHLPFEWWQRHGGLGPDLAPRPSPSILQEPDAVDAINNAPSLRPELCPLGVAEEP